MPRTRTLPPHGPDALDRLRELVESDPRNQSAIAAAAGMDRRQLSAVMTGERRDPAVSTIARLLAALGRTWADLDGD